MTGKDEMRKTFPGRRRVYWRWDGSEKRKVSKVKGQSFLIGIIRGWYLPEKQAPIPCGSEDRNVMEGREKGRIETHIMVAKPN